MSKLFQVVVNYNSCDRNVIQLTHNQLNMTEVSFADNTVRKGGAGVVTAIASTLIGERVKSLVSIRVPYDEIVIDAGFASISQGTEMNMTDSKIYNNQGKLAASILSLGHNKIYVENTDFRDSQGGAGHSSIVIQGAEKATFVDSLFEADTGLSAIEA